MNILLNLLFVFSSITSGYYETFIFGNIAILHNLFFTRRLQKINLATILSMLLLIVPVFYYVYGFDSRSLGNDLSTIIVISLFISNFVEIKLIKILKNLELILLSCSFLGLFSIIFNLGNTNYSATTFVFPLLVLLLRDSFILNNLLKNLILKYSLIILFIINFFCIVSGSKLNLVLSLIFSAFYILRKYIINLKNLFDTRIPYIYFLFLSVFVFLIPLIRYIQTYIKIINTGWDKAYDIRYLIDIGIIKEFIDSNSFLFGNGTFSSPNKGDFIYKLKDLRTVTRDLSSHNFFSELLYRNGIVGILILFLIIILLFIPLNNVDRTIDNLLKTFLILILLSTYFLVYNCVYSEAWHILYLFLIGSVYFKFNYKFLRRDIL